MDTKELSRLSVDNDEFLERPKQYGACIDEVSSHFYERLSLPIASYEPFHQLTYELSVSYEPFLLLIFRGVINVISFSQRIQSLLLEDGVLNTVTLRNVVTCKQ
jgi:hypothetical protein